MNELIIKNYNLETTLLGGQAFNWDFIDGRYYGFTQDKIIVLKPARNSNFKNNEGLVQWQTYPKLNESKFISKYFALEENFEDILYKISNKDEHIQSAVKNITSVRILNQDFEQTLLSFILSSHKSIKGVRKLVRGLSKKYGEKIIIDEKEFYLFPKTEVVAKLSEEELRKIGAGFRAKYLKSAAERLLEFRKSKIDLYQDEDKTREELLKFFGIGDKIADCIMAFSLGFKSVTPLDIWGKRVLIDLYKVDSKLKYSEMREWYKNYFGEHTSIAGQFLFEYYRHNFAKTVSNDRK